VNDNITLNQGNTFVDSRFILLLKQTKKVVCRKAGDSKRKF